MIILNGFAVVWVASACNIWYKVPFGRGVLFAAAFAGASASVFSALGIYFRVNP
jgi:hypothetical protein